jgi:hypothetical protein
VEEPAVIDLFEAAGAVQSLCDELGLRSCFIGGVAVQRWGEPRVTRDVAIAVLADFGHERLVARRLLSRLEARISDAESFAVDNRVVLASIDGIGVDISLAALPFEKHMIRGATPFRFSSGVELRTCSAEDLVIMKAFAARPQDWLDVQRVIERNDSLDWPAILPVVQALAELKADETIVPKLNALRDAARTHAQ